LEQAPTLGALIEVWCELHRKQTAHVRCARWCQEALGALCKRPVTSISTERVEDWISAFQEAHSPASINQVLRYLKDWCRWAIKRKTLQGMPYDVPPRRVEKKVRPVVKVDTMGVFLNAVDVRLICKDGTPSMATDQVRAAVRMMVGMGLREAEVLGARWEWLDEARAEYTVGKAKGMRPRTLGVPDWVLSKLVALPRSVSGLIFPGQNGKPHPQGWLRRALARGGRAVPGLVGTLGNHRLRASFATLHAAACTPISDIKAMMGHQNISTTMSYIEDDLGQQKAAQERLSLLLKVGG